MSEARGNRSALNFNQLELLENQILPTARRWVADYPGLADHGRQTLAYWGEYDTYRQAAE